MFIESVRARATCNTIISSHPVPSHRPCTNSFLLSVHASRSFPLLISFFFSLAHSSILIYFYFPFHIVQFASSHPDSIFYWKSCLFVRFDLVSSLPPPLSFFPLLSLFSFFIPSTVVILFPRGRNPHRAPDILSPVVFTTSIQSYLIWRRLAWNRHATVPPFSLSSSPGRGSFISGIEGKEIERPAVDYECHFYMTLFSYFSLLSPPLVHVNNTTEDIRENRRLDIAASNHWISLGQVEIISLRRKIIIVFHSCTSSNGWIEIIFIYNFHKHRMKIK